MVFKVSVQVYRTSWYSKESVNKAKFWSYVVMHPVFDKSSVKAGRDEYEGVVVAVGQWTYWNIK